VQGVDQRLIHLEKRFAAGQDDVASRARSGPLGFNGVCQCLGVGKAPASGAVHAHEICVAKGAYRYCAVLLAA
jgi:hypothetical protein